jgi:hypothetical protein
MMKRRTFLLSGTACAALAVTACGGGGSEEPLDGAGAEAPAGGGGAADASTPTDVLSGPARTAAVAYPFGSRLVPYAAGTRPSQSNATMDRWLTTHYQAWKAARVAPVPGIPGGLAISMTTRNFLAVSEGMGYGMLLAVLFAGHDPDARALFDGLLTTVRARPAYAVVPSDPNGKYLMEWQLNTDGSSAGEGWNATDGDEDIAMALLMADRQWGSDTGKWNYAQEAANTIAALKSWCMDAAGHVKGLSSARATRTSDFMIGHFRAFERATGDALWTRAIDRSYELCDLMQEQFSSGTGLIPDFISHYDTSNPIPSPAYQGTDRNAYDGTFYWNACRNPWRFATDYVLSGDARWKTITGRLTDFFQAKFDGSKDITAAVECGYHLDGSVIAGGDSAAFIAPVMLGGCVDRRYQALVDAGWNWNIAHPITGYYDAEIQLLSMVVASGNWWTP